MAVAGRGRATAGPGQDIPQMGGGFPQMATPGAFSPAQQSTQRANPPHSNIYKQHNSWNACISCGFNVDYGHIMQTCPAHWRKANHQESYVSTNTHQFIDAGTTWAPKVCTSWYYQSLGPIWKQINVKNSFCFYYFFGPN